MAIARTNAPSVVTREVWATKNNGSALAAKVSAPDVDGYTFVCWVGVATDGDVGTPYVERATKKDTNIWDAAKRGMNVVATALYRLS